MKRLKELYGSDHAAFEAGWRWAAEPLPDKHLHHYYPPSKLDAFRGIQCGPLGLPHGDTMIILDELKKDESFFNSYGASFITFKVLD